MATDDAPRESYLHKTPVELLRIIGSQLDTPGELFRFASVCIHVASAIDVFDFCKKDLEYQQAFRDCKNDPIIQEARCLDLRRCVYKLDSTIPSDEIEPPLYRFTRGLYQPCLLWAIEKGADIETIRLIIEIHLEDFPGGLGGCWYPGSSYHDCDRRIIYVLFHSPAFVAAKAGRADVIQALVEYGVDIRGRRLSLSTRFYPTLRSSPDRQLIRGALRLDNTFSAACEAGDDFALFMISDILTVQPSDLWFAVQSGCFRVIETLLKHPVFNGGDRTRIIRTLLKWAALDEYVRDRRVIQVLLDILIEPSSQLSWVVALLDEHDVLAANRARGYLVSYGPRLNPILTHLFDLYIKLAPEPLIRVDFAIWACRRDENLETLKTMLSKYSWSDQWESLRTHSMYAEALIYGSHNIARYLIGLGAKIDTSDARFHRVFYNVIHSRDLESIDIMIGDGGRDLLNIRCDKHSLHTPLEIALGVSNSAPNRFLPLLRLLHHGAGYEVPHHYKKYLRRELRFDSFLYEYLYGATKGAQIEQPRRPSFSQRVSSIDSPLYGEQLHGMARLILGRRYERQVKANNFFKERPLTYQVGERAYRYL